MAKAEPTPDQARIIMVKLTRLTLVCLLVGCSGTVPPGRTGCIPGDPGGSPACQQQTYINF